MKRRFTRTMAIGLLVSVIMVFAMAPQALSKTIVFGANTPGSLFYVMAAGMAKTISANSPNKVEVFPQGGTVWYPMLESGEVDFGIQVPGDILTAYMGDAIYKKPTKGKGFALRTLMLGSPLMVGFLVPDNTDIKTVKDIKGKRMPVDYGAFYSATLTIKALLANAGYSASDVKGLRVTTYVAGVRTLIEGRADLTMGSAGSGITKELKTAKGARYLNLLTSPEAVARLKSVHPGYYPIKAKAGRLAGLAKATTLLGKDITLVCGERQSEEVAYQITKALWENYKELAPVHPRLKFWTPNRFASTRAVVPYHPGSIKWYKEKGVWTQEMEDHQKKLLTIK
ncbi:MAG: TAXI family TRAP transporter solute-binding subunit [Deltaproteobacteria bacterium]|nr:TAXI family TRAP transporter solute-binding subunit [Deltaproteobacteria bacterium]